MRRHPTGTFVAAPPPPPLSAHRLAPTCRGWAAPQLPKADALSVVWTAPPAILGDLSWSRVLSLHPRAPWHWERTSSSSSTRKHGHISQILTDQRTAKALTTHYLVHWWIENTGCRHGTIKNGFLMDFLKSEIKTIKISWKMKMEDHSWKF